MDDAAIQQLENIQLYKKPYGMTRLIFNVIVALEHCQQFPQDLLYVGDRHCTDLQFINGIISLCEDELQWKRRNSTGFIWLTWRLLWLDTLPSSQIIDQLRNRIEVLSMIEYLESPIDNNADDLQVKFRSFDKEMILSTVKHYPNAFIYLSEQFRDDEDVVLCAILQAPRNLQLYLTASNRLMEDKRFALQILKQHGTIGLFPPEIRNDADCAFAAVSLDEKAIDYIGLNLLGDRSFLKRLFRKHGFRIPYANRFLLQDFRYARLFITSRRTHSYGDLMQITHLIHTHDRELAMHAVRYDKVAYQALSSRFKRDEEIILCLLRYNPWYMNQINHKALKTISPAQILEASPLAFSMILAKDSFEFNNAMKMNLALNLVASDIHCLNHLRPKTIRRNREIILAAIVNSPDPGKHAILYPELYQDHWSDYDIVKRLVRSDGRILAHVKYPLNADRDIVAMALRDRGDTIIHADETLRSDLEIIKLALSCPHNNSVLEEYGHLWDDEPIISLAVSFNGRALRFASPRLQSMKHIVWKAISHDGSALEFASYEWRTDEKMRNHAMRVLSRQTKVTFKSVA